MWRESLTLQEQENSTGALYPVAAESADTSGRAPRQDKTAHIYVCRYYQPNAPKKGADTGLSTPPPAFQTLSDDGEPRDVKIKSDITSSKSSSPDTALTAFSQLVAWRTGAQRAMIRYGLSPQVQGMHLLTLVKCHRRGNSVLHCREHQDG
jgi:hypothetical protein